MITEAEANANLLAHIMKQLRDAGFDVQDPIDIPDAIDELIERAK